MQYTPTHGICTVVLCGALSNAIHNESHYNTMYTEYICCHSTQVCILATAHKYEYVKKITKSICDATHMTFREEIANVLIILVRAWYTNINQHKLDLYKI